MIVEMITKEDLQHFRKQLLEEITALLNVGKKTEGKDWLRSAQVREILKISAGTLQNLRISGHLKPTKIAGTFYYSRSEIMTLLEGESGNKPRKL
jgi:hypothetical protein